MYVHKYLEAKRTYAKLKKIHERYINIPADNIGGAGIVIIVQLHNKPAVLIVHNKLTNKWDIPGGKIDPDENPTVTASRELREETKGLFKISHNILKDIPFRDKINPDTQHIYRSYFMYTTLPIIEFYYDNLSTLDIRARQTDISSSYFETDEIDFLYLDQFYQDITISKSVDLYTRRSNESPIILRRRDTAILRDSHDIIMKLLKTQPMGLKFASGDTKTSISYLKELKCYWL